jgi:hypothetical protein
VLTLNPLNTLSNNQVEEKIEAGFTAINLNKLNFNQRTANEIADGNYQFIYMSPEIFLNNKIWDDVYFSLALQNRLSLVVIDEAHMIYIWGLVKIRPWQASSQNVWPPARRRYFPAFLWKSRRPAPITERQTNTSVVSNMLASSSKSNQRESLT